MSTLTIQLPDSLHRNVQKLAEKEGYTIDQFFATAAAEKMSALLTLDFLRDEAAKADRAGFERWMAAVPAGPVMETDRMPE
jgi:predicted transcriptional regulator